MSERFCAAVNCMDGRVQAPVADYLRDRLGVDHVDTVTEAGPVRALAGEERPAVRDSILDRLRISIAAHGTRAVAIAAHEDCAGNPVPDEEQRSQLREAARRLAGLLPETDVVALWVELDGTVEEMDL